MSPTNEIVPSIEKFEASTCEVKIRTSGKGGLSLVCSSNGKRLTLSKVFLESLSAPESIQIAYSEDFMAISPNFGEAHTDYLLKKGGDHAVIYNAALVKEIVDRFELDFSIRTSMTFSNFHVEENEGQPIIYIKMRSEKE